MPGAQDPGSHDPLRERWQEVDALLERALDCPQEERRAFLERTCGDDRELFDAVSALIRASEQAEGGLGAPGSALLREALSESGTMLGAYRLLEPLGFGGMGTVYLAERADGQFEQKVALKVVKRATRGADLEKRFLRERQILARLQHDSIARLYDGGLTSDGRPYFVMELVEGIPITEYCEPGPVPLERRIELVEAVGDAVHYAHGHGVIHRDLKPRNILVTRTGKVKLLDFGIAKLAGDDPGETLTRTGEYVLTPAYASPEQVRGMPVTEASDVFQLGLVLYELVAGRAPIGDTPTPPTLVAGGRRVTDLDRICLKALSTDPERRYASARQFSDDLRRFRGRRPVTARAGGVVYRTSRFLERNRAGVGLVAALIMVSLIAGYVLGQGGGGPSGAAAVPGWVVVLAGALALGLVALVVRTGAGPSVPTLAESPGPVGARPETLDKEDATTTDGAESDSSEGPDPHTVAVLPFETLGSQDTDAFSAGLHEDLLTELSRVSALTVISRTSTLRYRGSGKTITQIGRELGAGTVIEGTVQRAGGRVRLNVQVIDARRDVHRWAERYDRELTAANVFDLQSELVARIAQAIRAELTPQEEERLARRPTDDLEAYRLYVEGRAQLIQRTEIGMRHALEAFQSAVARDAGYALAWAGLSEAVALLQWYDYQVPAGAPDPEEAALRSLRLDPDLAEGHVSLGIVRSIQRDGPAMLGELRRAVELQPSHAEALIWLAWFYLLVGRPRDGLEPTERAVALNPLAPAVRVFRAEVLLANDDRETALDEASRAREIQPDFGLTHFVEGLVLVHLGRHRAAGEAFERAWALVPPRGAPRHAEIRSVLAVTRAAAGDLDGAAGHLAGIEEKAPGDGFWTGLAIAALGKVDEAFAAMERVVRWGWFETEALRYFFPRVLGPLRDDPRYRALIAAADRSWGTAGSGRA